MNKIFRAATLLMLFALCTTRADAGEEDNFWKWFAANETQLFAFEANQPAILDEVGKQLTRINKDLTFDFGPVENGKREFVISASGTRSAFPAVEALYNKAPSLKRWVWIKFRPPSLPMSDVMVSDKQVRVDDVRYVLAKDGDKVGIMLFFNDYSEQDKETFDQIGYLFLEEALGEFVVETRVGFIESQSRESSYFAQSSALRQLPIQFAKYWDR